MHKNRILSIMLTLILFIGLITGNCSGVMAEGIQTSLPKDLNVRISSNEFRFGDMVNLRIQTSESVDDLGDKAYIAYKIMKGNNEITKELELNKEGSSFVTEFEIEENFESGLWEVDFIVVPKRGVNIIVYNNGTHNFKGESVNHRDLSHINFSVNEIADYQLFKKVSTDINYVKLLDKVTLSVEATDKEIDLLDQAYAVYVLESENGTLTREITLDRTGENLYKKELIIDESYAEGTWKLDYVILKEKSGTTKVTYNKDIHGNLDLDCFKVMASADLVVQGDNEGPEILGLSKEEIDDMPGTYEVRISAQDESGLNEKAWIKYVSGDGTSLEREVTLELRENEYVGTVVLDNYRVWHADFVLLKDALGNTKCVYNENLHEVNTGDLDSLKTTVDNRMPAIQNMELTKSEIDGSYELKIYTDKDSVKLEQFAYAVYETEYDDAIIEKEVRLELTNGVYVGEFSVEEYAKALTWNVKFVVLKDLLGNTGVYYNNISGDGGDSFIDMGIVSFTSKGEDAEGPRLTAIRLNQESIFVEIEVEATDDRTDLARWSYVALTNNLGDTKESKLELVDGRYRGTIEFNNDNEGEEWSVDYIILRDINNNESIVYNAKLHGDFGTTVDMSSVEIKLPKANVLSVSPVSGEDNVFNLGKAIKLELKVEKGVYPLADIAYVSYIKNDNGMNISKEIKFTKVDESTYEAEFIPESYVDIGNWKVDYVIVSDVEGNKNIVYNSEINGLGEDLSTGELIIGEVVVNRINNNVIQSGVDFVESFSINNYTEDERFVNVVIELKGENEGLISKVRARKLVNARSKEIIDVRMRINPNAKYINIIILDNEGNEIYRIIDSLPLK